MIKLGTELDVIDNLVGWGDKKVVRLWLVKYKSIYQNKYVYKVLGLHQFPNKNFDGWGTMFESTSLKLAREYMKLHTAPQ